MVLILNLLLIGWLFLVCTSSNSIQFAFTADEPDWSTVQDENETPEDVADEDTEIIPVQDDARVTFSEHACM